MTFYEILFELLDDDLLNLIQDHTLSLLISATET